MIKNNDKNGIYQELIKNQRKSLDTSKQLDLSDLKRISNYLSSSIFTDKCSLWNGYITQFKNKGSYINFFYKGKKTALHRLLYYNYIGDIQENEYLKYNCENKGKCCCINHIVKSNLDKSTPPCIDISSNPVTESESEPKQKKKIIIGF